MTNVETRSERVILSSFWLRLPSSFVVWVRARFERAEDRWFLGRDFFADEDQVRTIRLERLQVPAAGHKIEKLRTIRKKHEAFRPMHTCGQTVCKAFKEIVRKSFVGAECERLEFGLMFVLRRRHLSLPADAEQ